MRTKLHLLSLVLAFVCAMTGQAQDFTFSQGEQTFTHEQGTMLLVPWDSKMFLSDINREIHNRTGLELDEIKRLFREGFCQMYGQEATEKFSVVDLTEDIDGHASDLEYIHSSVSYTYVKMPPPPVENENKAMALINRFKQKEAPDQKQRGVNVDDGELYTYYDEKERFMETQINNPDLVSYLVETYDCDYIVFLNELDIRVLRDHNQERGQVWDRQVKVHYTVFDAQGEKLASNAAYSLFEGQEKDIYAIIRRNFTEPSKRILEGITQALAEQQNTAEENDDDY